MAKKQIKKSTVINSDNNVKVNSSIEKQDFFVKWTQLYLERRKRKKYIQKIRQKRKNFVEDWGGALLWAACVVLLINQFFFQAYRIPSGSMVDTLNEGDMLFVNKMVYGPELIPGYAKIPSIIKPSRSKVIILESPQYQSKGAVFDLVTRMIYMLTFSLVNLDKEGGEAAVHFLVKRAIGEEGDFISFGNEQLYIEPKGLGEKVVEGNLFNELQLQNNTQYRDFNSKNQPINDPYYNSTFPYNYHYFTSQPQRIELEKSGVIYDARFLAMRDHYGFYVEKDYILPLGDNRNNSLDGRTWGTVHKDKILGRVSIRYWPFNRAGVPK